MELLNDTLCNMTVTGIMAATRVDTDTGDEEVEYDEISPKWVWTIVDCVLMVIIVCGNTLTILAVTMNRRLYNLISNKFVLNLAISDLCVGLALPYHLAFYLHDGLGGFKTTCIMRYMLIMLACCASILNLLLIAIDRYIAIIHPLQYSRYMNRLATGILMVVGWVVAGGLCLVPIFWNTWDECDACVWHKIIPKVYTTCVLAPLFGIIWLVMLALYWKIWREAVLHTQRMRTTTHSTSEVNESKSIQVVLIVLGSFSICWIPYVVVICTQAAIPRTSNNRELYKAVFSLAMINSGVNPFIYAWKNKGFRRAFLRLLRCRGPETPDFGRSFRKAVERKLPLDTIGETPGSAENQSSAREDISRDERSIESDRYRIMENSGFDCKSDSINIVENLGYDDTADKYAARATDSSAVGSDGDSVVTLPIGCADVDSTGRSDVQTLT